MRSRRHSSGLIVVRVFLVGVFVAAGSWLVSFYRGAGGSFEPVDLAHDIPAFVTMLVPAIHELTDYTSGVFALIG